ncbi:hypothetical protein [Clostridium sp. UBA6640]|uniref:hypothetical protein n=1 Tax=Clostridium sp. UBA6640 TaxID=1946370 RepID=UPI0025BE416F|nr:hypothetical protein [Clostridium sp. UBA6640]
MRRESYGIIFWGDSTRKARKKRKEMEMNEYIEDIGLEALVKQNWLILKKLDSIDKNLKELNNK